MSKGESRLPPISCARSKGKPLLDKDNSLYLKLLIRLELQTQDPAYF